MNVYAEYTVVMRCQVLGMSWKTDQQDESLLTMQVVYDVFLQIRIAKLVLLRLCRPLLLLLPCLHGLGPCIPHNSLTHSSMHTALVTCHKQMHAQFADFCVHLAFTQGNLES